jgi:hypothetical protein
MTKITIAANGTKVRISGIGTLSVDEFRHLIERRAPSTAEYAFAEAFVLNEDGDFDRALVAAFPEATAWPKRTRNRMINRLLATTAVANVIQTGFHEAHARLHGKAAADRIVGN